MPSLALPSSSSSSSSPLLLPSMAPAFWERPEEEEEEEENNPHPKMKKKKGLSPIFPICLEPDPLDWQAMEFIVHLPPKPPAPRVHRVSVNETKEKEKEIEEEDEDGSLSERTPDEGGGVRRFFPLLPPIDPSKTHTLVLDLDETLLHCSTCPMPSASITFSVELNHMHFDIYGNLRPYLAFFLATVAKVYEVVVFTASQAVYAQRVVQWVDPNHQFISHCLYRDSCVFINGTYLKDLSLLGRDLATTLIVDNTPQSFGYHLANGIPIRSWYNDPEDHQLVHLSHVLLHLATYPDVRWVVKEWSLVHRYVDQQRRDRHLGLSLSLKKES
ncbi:hypothetical protein HMI54_010696 [Coelomomyces lativittatus]|nr:hypothetical protein HMI54_010696 [Coelomomyces lativittatus]